MKRFFFLCTNKDGGRHSKRERFIAIAHLWMSGLTDTFLDALEKEKNSMGNNDYERNDDENENIEDIIHDV